MISEDGEMARLEPETVAGKATAESGVVLLDGPGGVAVAMTPEAARETGHSLIAAADQADFQPHDIVQETT
ncbi:hypothetical protein IFT82_12000 [Sphingomonas sp. CFBP 8760]|nr:hypothetical protein [Sphingomonas sp. CFBP 8760]